MNDTQKVIKYFAVSLAVLLIVFIFGSIAMSVITLGNIFINDGDAVLTESKEEVISQTSTIDKLTIDVKSTNLVINKGEVDSDIKITTDNKYITYKNSNGEIKVKEKKHNYFGKSAKTTTTITLPENIMLKEVDIDAGAGTVHIEKILADIFDLELGAGSIVIDDLVVDSKADIDSGAGKVTIKDGKINNLDLDLGVGSFTLNTILTGKNKIDAGVGEVNINLLDNLSNYHLDLDKGIGSITINDEEVKGNKVYGTGSNTIDIDGGVGKININFNDKKESAISMRVNFNINGNIYEAILEDTATTSALLEMLPLEISMTDLNNNEKYSNLSKALPKNEYYPGKIEAGDIMLYGSDTLVIFYENANNNYAYTKIGKITKTSSFQEDLKKSDTIKITK